jgi:hypothetical protein
VGKQLAHDQYSPAPVSDVANNPAGRLHGILQRGLDEVHVNAQVKDAWRELLKTDKDDATLYRRYAQLVALPGEIRVLVSTLEDVNRTLILEPLDAVEEALAQPFTTTWQSVRAMLSDKAMWGLQVLDDRLRRATDERALEQEQLNDLQTSLHALADEVLLAEPLDAALRATLVEHLAAMFTAVDEAMTRGGGAVIEAVERSVGAVFIRHPRAVNEEPSRSWVQKFFTMANRALTLVTLASGTLELTADALEALPE